MARLKLVGITLNINKTLRLAKEFCCFVTTIIMVIMVKFNPGLSQILSKVFSSTNLSLELTKYFCVFTPRFNDDNLEFYSR